MLEEFLVTNRDTIIANARARVATRISAAPTTDELTSAVPIFLEQLGAALRLAKSSEVIDHDALCATASQHGRDLLQTGLTIGQVVHDYGDICQVVTGLAAQLHAPIDADEFKTLNLCLDDAIAGAVSAYALQRERSVADEGTERLGFFAHEMRNYLNTAMLSFECIKSGHVAPGGGTGHCLDRSLLGLRDLIDRSLTVVRLDAGVQHVERVSVAELVEELEIGATMHAKARGVHFSSTVIDRTVTIEGDRQMLVAAVSNLLQNAFKFTKKDSRVSLTTRATYDRVLFEVEDECGGLPPGKTEELFVPFEQCGADVTGIGLGLSICAQAARANGGEIRARDIPGKGCVFTLDLPRSAPPPMTVVQGGKDGPGGAGVEPVRLATGDGSMARDGA